jgi:hypothetical protein
MRFDSLASPRISSLRELNYRDGRRQVNNNYPPIKVLLPSYPVNKCIKCCIEYTSPERDSNVCGDRH